MAFLSIADTITRKAIIPDMAELVFLNDPLLAYAKANCLETLPALTFQENIQYQTHAPIAFGDNVTFDMSQFQVETGLTFTARKYGVPVSASLDKLNIDYYGEEAVVDYLDERLSNAAKSMSARLAIALYKDGQSSGRTDELNGLDEALSDGSTNGWQARTYTAYGTVTRTTVNSVLNSPMTSPAAALASISYPNLEQSYNSVVVGNQEPNLIVTTNLGMSFIKMAFQGQQRFEGSGSVTQFGFRGVGFNGATIMQSQYCPGTKGTNDAKLGNYLASAGETLWILNVRREHMRFYVSPTELFGFGFTGWKPGQDNLTVGGQYLFAGNFTCRGAKYSRQHHSITA